MKRVEGGSREPLLPLRTVNSAYRTVHIQYGIHGREAYTREGSREATYVHTQGGIYPPLYTLRYIERYNTRV